MDDKDTDGVIVCDAMREVVMVLVIERVMTNDVEAETVDVATRDTVRVVLTLNVSVPVPVREIDVVRLFVSDCVPVQLTVDVFV